ncbi:uncharacterized protein PHALS_01756 [Plasmopara halstedii]|uniref:Uncharacterized protein n=1 Tax=Plasmopara halstedii TaxID=4781 RepID=A0A0P1AVB3_PLAHL|nr:uncharacterized protein PHALS_01756 [Plasmopara halstedii]CEG45463.1 hypothetical protein PHALS_01756 [Plasmopara halstedii]|eukprot:XP_024581832.1 hypothetical protein PHALS_01756 [Plasmopara halstedii]
MNDSLSEARGDFSSPPPISYHRMLRHAKHAVMSLTFLFRLDIRRSRKTCLFQLNAILSALAPLLLFYRVFQQLVYHFAVYCFLPDFSLLRLAHFSPTMLSSVLPS